MKARPRGELRNTAIDVEREVGRHEETVEQAERHIVFRLARVVSGIVVVGVGVVLLALPGPGLIVIAIGLAVLSRDVPFAGRLLARVRDRLPDNGDGQLPARFVTIAVGTAMASLAFGTWWAVVR